MRASRFFLSFSALALFVAGSAAARFPEKPHFAPGDPNSKITSALRQTLEGIEAAAQRQGTASARLARQMQTPLMRVNEDGEIQIYLKVTSTDAAVQAELSQLGARIVRFADDLKLIEAWILPDRVREVAAHPAVTSVRPVMPPIRRAGSVMTEGDAILGADVVRALGFDGTGVKIGVISDDVDHLSAAQATGDLPQHVAVLQRTTDAGDEGTAMLEIVHDLAPGAALHFASGWGSALHMREAIFALANSGCNVIVDDLGFADQPLFFEDGFLSDAIDLVNSRGVVYCSAAGNSAQEMYSGDYTPVDEQDWLHAWNGSNDGYMGVRVPASGTLQVILEWNDHYGQTSNDYDLYLVDSQLNTLASSDDPQQGQGDPREHLAWQNPLNEDVVVFLAVQLALGYPRRLGLFIDGASEVEYVTPSGSVWGHPSARGAIAVGAINATDPGNDDIASYSSQGPVHISYPFPEIRQKPDLCGIDNGLITGAGGFGEGSAPNVRFSGTSAAAPHVAAVAALLRQAHPDWTPMQVRQALTSTALDLGSPGPDNLFGAGLVQARAALDVQFPSGTTVAGTISTTTWTEAGSPYRVTGTLTVPTGNTLTIESGVDVLFDADVKFIVEGRLNAFGTSSDSIRFLAGSAGQWKGLVFLSQGEADSSRLEHVRVSGGWARYPDWAGGGTYLYGEQTRVVFANSVLRGNRADFGGGVFNSNFSRVQLRNCTLDGNTAIQKGGAVGSANNSITELVNCTIVNNSVNAAGGGTVYSGLTTGGRAVITNCIIGGNSSFPQVTIEPSVPDSIIRVTFSDVDGGYVGTGNLDADPLFVDAAGGDYHLQAGSPCIDAGDPSSPLDPDGTRADIGAFFFHQGATLIEGILTLPTASIAPGGAAILPIRATLTNAFAADLAFVVDTSVIVPDADFIRGHAFSEQANALADWYMKRDTVIVALSCDQLQPVTLNDEALVELAFVAKNVAMGSVAQLAWVPFPKTNVNEEAVELVDGVVTAILYGDASGDGTLSALDASYVLQFVVGKVPEIPFAVSDVTGNGQISSFDAAWILYKTIYPVALFPVEGGSLPRRAPSPLLTLSWEPAGSGWSLAANDATGIMAGDLVLTLPDDIPVQIGGEIVSAFRQDERTLFVSFVRTETGGNALLSLNMASDQPPQIVSASLNEGIIPLLSPEPVAFSLSQNTPNPFNPSTTLRFALPEAGHVTLAVYDINGRLVRMLVGRTFLSGHHEVVWDGRDATGREVASGVYVYQLTAKEGVLTRRMTLAR